MAGPTPRHPLEFKWEAVELYRSSEKSIPKQEGGSCCRLREEELRGHEVSQDPGGGPHVCRPAGRLRVPGLPPRCPLPQDRRVAMEDRLGAEIVVDALRMALGRREPAPGLVRHSDQGVHYTAPSSGEGSEGVAITPSRGRTGTALDNAMAESLVSTLKAELVSRMEFPTRQAAKTAIFEYLGTFYNTRRLHSSLSYRSPVHFEEDRMEEAGIA